MAAGRFTPLLSVALAAAALAGGYLLSRALLPPAPETGAPLLRGDFTLQSAGGPVSLADFSGQVVVIYFGYTFCPDACPTTLGALASALKELTPEAREQVQPLLISIDPQRDTPQRLAEYVAFFSPRLIGLTGSEQVVAEAAKRYGVYYQVHKSGAADDNYTVDHTSRLYVLGRDGRLIAPLEHGTPPTEIAAALREALQE